MSATWAAVVGFAFGVWVGFGAAVVQVKRTKRAMRR